MVFNEDNDLNRHSAIPLHQQLCWLLEEKINDGTLKVEDKLPSENELMDVFDVSRQVVRQSINNLRQQGLIYTKHGLGSFVSPSKIDKNLSILQSYHKSMDESNLQVELKITKKDVIQTPDEVAYKLKTNVSKVFLLERVSYFKRSPVNIVISYLLPGKCDFDRLMTFDGGSLYEFLLDNFGIKFLQSSNTIEVFYAREHESQLLDVPIGKTLIEIASQSFYQDEPLEYSKVIYSASAVRFHFDSYIQKDSQQENVYIKPNTSVKSRD